MSKRRRKQIVERIKSLLIVLLSCSAVYLVVLTQSIAVPSGLLSGHPQEAEDSRWPILLRRPGRCVWQL